MGLKQSFCYPMYRSAGRTADEVLTAAADIGYAAVEFWQRDGMDAYEQFIETARRRGLTIASMAGHQSLGDGLNKRENHDRIESELRASIDVAARHGIPGLICFSGNRQPNQSDAEGMIACAAGLRRIAPYAEEKGVNLNIELLNSKIDHPGYLADHVGWGMALCEMVDSPRVRLLLDIYHVQIMEGDLIRNIRRAATRTGHYHTAGNPGRGPLDDGQEINYRAVCAAIVATGYDLFIGHEFKPTGDVVEALRHAYNVCAGTS